MTDVAYKILRICRGMIWSALKNNYKSARTMKLIGCTVLELKFYIEKQFLPGMSWNNWGYGDTKWNLHHIKFCCTFDLSDPEQQKLCFHYTNLIPIWEKDHKLLHKNNSR